MAALDLTSLPLPSTRAQASVGTTLREIIPPRGARRISVRGSAALYLQLGSGFADGDAVNTTDYAVPLDANVSWDWGLSGGSAVPQNPPPRVYVAAQSGTATIYVLVEG